MIKWAVRAVCALALVGLGAAFGAIRAQSPATFSGTFRHVGFVVRDVDASATSLSRVFNASYSPVHSVVPPGPPPKGYPGDPKAGVRTTEMKTNGMEIHLLQPTGGRSPWRDGLERHGDGSLQHISFGVTDLAGSVAALEKLGGHLTAGAGDGFFAYVEFQQLPFTIELEKVAR